MPQNRLRERLQKRETSYGLAVTLESPTVTEIAVTLGLDFVMIDTEHGHLDQREVMEHLRVVRGTETTALVRVPEIAQTPIKRALDIGAHGVMLPLVRSREDAERGMRLARYPPQGERGVGGERAVKWGLGYQEYLAAANEEILVLPMIETREAVENIDAILAVPGVEAILFGPADLSSSYGHLGEWEAAGVGQQILDIRAKAAARGIASAIMARSVEEAVRRRDEGFGLVLLGSDVGLLIRSLNQTLEPLGRRSPPRLWF